MRKIHFIKVITCIALLFPAQAYAGYDPAETLKNLNKQIEGVTLLMKLDEIDAYINRQDLCGNNARVLRDRRKKLEQLNAEYDAGQLSGTSYNNSFDKHSKFEENASTLFNKCFTNELDKLLALGAYSYDKTSYPDVQALNKRTWKELSDTYAAILKRYYHSSLPKNELQKLKEKRINYILDSGNSLAAVITSTSSGVKVFRNNKQRWTDAEKGDVLTVDDAIKTGKNGLAKVSFLSNFLLRKGVLTKIDIMPNTEFKIEKFRMDYSTRQLVILLTYGYIHAFTRGWKKGSVFSVRAGTTLCGIRGTDIEIHHDPDDDRAFYKLHSGIVDITTPSEKFVLNAGHEVSITEGIRGDIRKSQSAPPL